ncbi:MAG: ABC transporter substrate-binding protein, partial [Actinomycetota bacterium]|nr:ABC transporter substrate-binding protein [Actinomycetota bacterium]
ANRFEQAMTERNATVDYSRAVSRAAGAAEARVVVEEMKALGIDNAFALTSPVFFLQLLSEANTQDFHPLWTGIGLTMTFDTVATVACRNDDTVRARFFSPYPAFADRDRFDPNFDRAVARFHSPRDADDFMWQLWAQSRILREMLERTGRRLTRNRFVSSVERSTIKTGIVPKLVYRPSDHFGGAAVHVLKLDCAQRRWVTNRAFVRDF